MKNRKLCPRGTCIPDPAKNKEAITPEGDRYIVGQCKNCGVTLITRVDRPSPPRKSDDAAYRELTEQADHERQIEHRGEWY